MATANNSKQAEENLKNVEFETSEDVEVVPTFQSMKLREDLLRGIYAYGTLILIYLTYIYRFSIWTIS